MLFLNVHQHLIKSILYSIKLWSISFQPCFYYFKTESVHKFLIRIPLHEFSFVVCLECYHLKCFECRDWCTNFIFIFEQKSSGSLWWFDNSFKNEIIWSNIACSSPHFISNGCFGRPSMITTTVDLPVWGWYRYSLSLLSFFSTIKGRRSSTGASLR